MAQTFRRTPGTAFRYDAPQNGGKDADGRIGAVP